MKQAGDRVAQGALKNKQKHLAFSVEENSVILIMPILIFHH